PRTGAVRPLALLRRLPSALRLLARQFPAAFTRLGRRIDRLFALRERLRRSPYRPPDPARLALAPLEPRLMPDGRPLPLPTIAVGGGTGSLVRGYDALTGELTFEHQVYEDAFTGGVRVASSDV